MSTVESTISQSVSTVAVTAAMGSAGQALPSTASSSIDLANNDVGQNPIQFKVGAESWRTMQSGEGRSLAINLAVTTVLLRKRSTTEGPVPVQLTVNTVTATSPAGGVPLPASALNAQDVAAAPSQRVAKDTIAHRGGGAQVQIENSMSAYKASGAAGLMHIEQDVYLLSDGALGCMHDATVDRTTSGTGSTESFTGTTFKALQLVGSKNNLGGSLPNENCVLFTEAIRELAPSGCVFWPEAKNTGSGHGIVAALLKNNIPTYRAVVQGVGIAELLPAIGADYPVNLVANPATADFAALKAQGVTYVAYSAWTAPQVLAAHAAGLKVILYTPVRQTVCDAAKALGVDMIFSDDPLWTSRQWRPMTRSPFYGQAFTPGMLAGGTVRGSFPGGDWFKVSNNVPGNAYAGVLQGWGCPIKNDPAAQSFVMDLQIKMVALNGADTSRHADIFVCAADDSPFQDAGVSGIINGYNILWRGTGAAQIFKVAAGQAAVSIASASGTAPTLGTAYTAKVTVTPTTITFAIAALGLSVTATDSTFRGGYFHFGVNSAEADFGSVVIS